MGESQPRDFIGVLEAIHSVDEFKSTGVFDREFPLKNFAELVELFMRIVFSKQLIFDCTEEILSGDDFVGLLLTIERRGAGCGGLWCGGDVFIFIASLLLQISMLLYKLMELEGLSLNFVFLSLLPTLLYFSLSFRKSGNSKFISVPR